MYPITHSPIHSQQNVVIDNLHLFLLESDVLIDLLIMKFQKMDLIKKQKVADFDPQKCKNLDWFQSLSPGLVCQLG